MGVILVTGATGSVGRMVVDHLLRAGATEIRALTNKPDKANLPPEVEVVRGYVGRPETVEPALDGVERMYLAPLPSTMAQVMALAAKAGVRHVVDLSGPADSHWASVAEAVEQAAQGTEMTWTHLAPGEFMENFFVWAPQITGSGEVRDPFPQAESAPIAMDDVAAVAAAVLLSEGHAARTYEMTGPDTLKRAEMVACIGKALGKEIPCIPVSREEAVELLRPAWGENAQWYVDLHAQMVEQAQPVMSTVSDILGRPGTSFAQWARLNVEAFR